MMKNKKEIEYSFKFGVSFGLLVNLVINVCNLYEYLEPEEVFRYEYYIFTKLIFIITYSICLGSMKKSL